MRRRRGKRSSCCGGGLWENTNIDLETGTEIVNDGGGDTHRDRYKGYTSRIHSHCALLLPKRFPQMTALSQNVKATDRQRSKKKETSTGSQIGKRRD